METAHTQTLHLEYIREKLTIWFIYFFYKVKYKM